MIKKNIVNKLLESNKIIVGNDIPKGIKMNFINNEIILTGDQKSLLELADYIISVALSEEAKDSTFPKARSSMKHRARILLVTKR